MEGLIFGILRYMKLKWNFGELKLGLHRANPSKQSVVS